MILQRPALVCLWSDGAGRCSGQSRHSQSPAVNSARPWCYLYKIAMLETCPVWEVCVSWCWYDGKFKLTIFNLSICLLIIKKLHTWYFWCQVLSLTFLTLNDVAVLSLFWSSCILVSLLITCRWHAVAGFLCICSPKSGCSSQFLSLTSMICIHMLPQGFH